MPLLLLPPRHRPLSRWRRCPRVLTTEADPFELDKRHNVGVRVARAVEHDAVVPVREGVDPERALRQVLAVSRGHIQCAEAPAHRHGGERAARAEHRAAGLTADPAGRRSTAPALRGSAGLCGSWWHFGYVWVLRQFAAAPEQLTAFHGT